MLSTWLDHVLSPGAPHDTAASRADAVAVGIYCSRMRWATTVGLQGFLGLFFALFPGATMDLLEVPATVEMAVLFRLYGVLLLYRAVMEQYVRIARDPRWVRAYMVSTLPFGIGSAVILSWAVATGLMNPLIGWIWVALFVAEDAEYLFVLTLHGAERRRLVRA